MNGRTTWLLLALAVGLGAVTANEMRTIARPPELPAPVTADPVAAPTPMPGVRLPALPALDTLSETVDRPLFNPDRRPPVVAEAPAAAPVAPVAVEPPRLALSAVVIADGSPLALMREAGTGKTVRVREGDTVSGWTVATIQPGEVGLTQGSRKHAVTLRTFEPPPQVAARARKPRRGAKADDAEQPAQVRRPRRPLRGPRKAARERQRQQARQNPAKAE